MNKKFQKFVKINISRAGIVVEMKPSSNTVIGDMDILTDNHIYNANKFSYVAITRVKQELELLYVSSYEENISLFVKDFNESDFKNIGFKKSLNFL